MGEIKPVELKLKTGEMLRIRPARPEDAGPVHQLAVLVIGELEFTLVEPEECLERVQMESWIKECAERRAWLFLVGEVDDSVIGIINLENGNRRRTAHCVWLHMIVDMNWRDRGAGRALLDCVINWARHEDLIEKLALSVFSSNQRAIALYHKLGFTEEGLRSKAYKLGPDQYQDEIIMHMLV